MPAEPEPEPAAGARADDEPAPDISAGPTGGAAADSTAAAPPAATDKDPAPEAVTVRADTPADTPMDTPADDDSPAPRRGLRLRGWQAATAAVAVAAAITAGVLATGGSGHTDSRAKDSAASDGLPHTPVDVSTGSCGKGWGTAGTAKPHAGTQVFDVHNSAASASEVDLTDPRTGKLYAEVEGLAPGTTRQMTVDLGSGTYAFRCLQEDTDAISGPTVTVPGKQPQGPAALPVTEHDLIPPTLAYQRWISGRMTELAHDTATLKDDIDQGDLTAARRDWLTGHLVYERMGAAYDTFGDADGVINGTVALDPGAVKDPGFTGFHRIEYGLWHGGSAASLRAPAAKLDSAVRALRTTWTTQRMDPADMGLRAHEIIENAEQFELTGRTDYGSGTNLATASANIDGTRAILARLNSLLVSRDTGLAELNSSLDRAQKDLDAQDRHGTWTPLAHLTHAQRQRINADFGDLLEQLAPVAAIFDVRRTT